MNIEADGVDWESLRTKYDIIMKIVHEIYSRTGNGEEFLHGESIQELYKAFITSKIKKLCSNYKKTADLGKRSGGRRIIMTFNGICQNI